MKKTIDLLWGVRWSFLKLWVFFFALSMFGLSKHSVLHLLLFSCAWSIVIITTSIMFVKLRKWFGK